MRDRFRRLPSPSMAVAFIALLAALGGTAVALPGSNTVTSGDIKRGAVRSSDIRNNTVTSTDIRNSTIRGRDVRNNSLTGADVTRIRGVDVTNDSLTGADINESTLGLVPNAANASTLGGQGPGSFESNSETIPFAIQQVGDGDKTIASVGPFRLFLRCDANDGGPNETAELILVSSVDYPAFDDNNGPEDAPVVANDEMVLNSSSEPGPNIDAEGDQGPYAIANVAGPGGLVLWVRSYALGQGLYAGDSCFASGAIETAQLG